MIVWTKVGRSRRFAATGSTREQMKLFSKKDLPAQWRFTLYAVEVDFAATAPSFIHRPCADSAIQWARIFVTSRAPLLSIGTPQHSLPGSCDPAPLRLSFRHRPSSSARLDLSNRPANFISSSHSSARPSAPPHCSRNPAMATRARLLRGVANGSCSHVSGLVAPAASRGLPKAAARLSSACRSSIIPQTRCLGSRSFSSTSASRAAKLTADSYPGLTRDSRFSQLTPEHVAYFKQVLGQDSAVIDGINADAAADIEPFNEDWMHKYKGQCRLVLKPGSTEEVSKILRYCNENMLAVVPQGGNTGLVGGSIPVFDEIVISMGRMNTIHSFDEMSGSLVLDAGCILEVADQHVAERGYIFPLDLGAKGSCHVGGNVSTNAGGLRLLRYGSLHGSVLGIEAVLPDGTIMNDMCTLRKNNTGYDLKQLFIGAEGTLGIITKLVVQCAQRSPAVNVALFGIESYEKAQKAFREAKLQLSEILSAFELMDGTSQRIVHQVRGGTKPLENDYPFYCLIETSGSNSEHDYEKLEKFLEDVMSNEVIADGVVAQDAYPDQDAVELAGRHHRVYWPLGWDVQV
ncbi:D-lactate ferricytochrome c oxidoreductase [Metarhizium acridum]|uniref:D-lactate ferricytochrome c oxidoreductase n=1 Tax=Metarhizium acridum TaxID=92637 RepID=UPI001C6B9051|nr:D-lactate ferricytochrome c oxidoreductase [Metarhizium acridum]